MLLISYLHSTYTQCRFYSLYVQDVQHLQHFKIQSRLPKCQRQLVLISTVKSQFKKDLNLETHLHKTFFFGLSVLDSVHNFFWNQIWFDVGKKKWGFLNQDLPELLLFSWHSKIWQTSDIWNNDKNTIVLPNVRI